VGKDPGETSSSHTFINECYSDTRSTRRIAGPNSLNAMAYRVLKALHFALCLMFALVHNNYPLVAVFVLSEQYTYLRRALIFVLLDNYNAYKID